MRAWMFTFPAILATPDSGSLWTVLWEPPPQEASPPPFISCAFSALFPPRKSTETLCSAPCLGLWEGWRGTGGAGRLTFASPVYVAVTS